MARATLGFNENILRALRESGVPDMLTRVVIDIQLDEPVRVYYECFADGKMLDVVLPAALNGAVLISAKDVDTEAAT